MSDKYWEHKKVREWTLYIKDINVIQMEIFQFIWNKKENENENASTAIELCVKELDKK